MNWPLVIAAGAVSAVGGLVALRCLNSILRILVPIAMFLAGAGVVVYLT